MVDVRWTESCPRLRVVVTSAAAMAAPRPPVLMLHGLWHAAWAWENWSGVLAARGYDCYAVDLRGHGGSEGDIRAARLRHYLQDARRAVAVMPETPILVGHSLGGTLVQHLLAAASYPAAVLVAGVPGRYPLGTFIRTAVTRPGKTLEAGLRNDLRPLVDTAVAARRVLFSPATRDDTVRLAQRRLTAAAPQVIRDLVLTPTARPRRTTRTLVLAARHDAVFTPGKQRSRARAIGADYREIRNSGHDIPLDDAWREAVDFTAEWLASR